VLVVGGEPDAGLVHEVERLGLAGTVLFTGPTRQVAAMYAAADAFVLPTYYDACSLAVLEAMACGLPAITTETNGIAGLLSPGTDGFVISHPPNEAELASVMEGLLDAEFRHQVGTAARAKAGRCTKRANHEAILALCERAALSHKKIDTPEGLGV
jgi:UDP-glucose:(heptosyl)LPS alpha-1,3-glucosyltransferase